MYNRGRFQRVVVIASLLLSVTLLQACGGGGAATRPDTVLQVDLVASGDVNSGDGKQGRPVVVRLYELKSAGSFSSADFFSLYEHEVQTLGPDMLGREEVSLAPGQRHRVDKVVTPETAYMGVIAAFRDIDGSKWRDVSRLRPDRVNKFKVTAAGNHISVAAN
jgi:type VI secretion system protein VasD